MVTDTSTAVTAKAYFIAPGTTIAAGRNLGDVSTEADRSRTRRLFRLRRNAIKHTGRHGASESVNNAESLLLLVAAMANRPQEGIEGLHCDISPFLARRCVREAEMNPHEEATVNDI